MQDQCQRDATRADGLFAAPTTYYGCHRRIDIEGGLSPTGYKPPLNEHSTPHHRELREPASRVPLHGKAC